MSKPKLIAEIKNVTLNWWKQRKRSSWLYCPVCHHDLNGDEKSFLEEKNDHWYYKCARCGCKSKWSLAFLLPVVVEYQRFQSKMRPADFSLSKETVTNKSGEETDEQ